MISRENSRGLMTEAMDCIRISCRSAGRRRRASTVRRCSSRDDDGRVGDLPDRNRQAGQREQVDRLVEADQRQRGEQHPEEQDGDRADRGSNVSQKQQRHDDQHRDLDQQRFEELTQGRPDPRRSIVGRHDLDARRQGRPDLIQLQRQRPRDGQDVLVLLHDRDAAHHLARAVEIDRAPALVVPHLEVANVPQMDGGAVGRPPQDQKVQLVEILAVDDARSW
jgi:hypothetical protein